MMISADKSNVPGQVSNGLMQNEQDAFFARSRGEREIRLSTFSQKMDSEDFARLEEALKLFDGEPDIKGKEFEQHLEKYFEDLIHLMGKAIDKQEAGAADRLVYCQAVEELYLINCEKVKRDNSYRIYGNHPIMLLNRRLEQETRKLLNDKEKKIPGDNGGSEAVDYDILDSVFRAKTKNRRRMLLYSRSAVYETDSEVPVNEKQFICARPFEQREENTEIPMIRIWEKINDYQDLHQEKKRTLLRIAVFGELSADLRGRELLKGLLDVDIQWTFLRRIPEMGEYLFSDETDENVYDLLDMIDVQTLVDSHEIILFLDQNCFYRQWQAKKEVEEKREGTNCRWYFERCGKKDDFRDKAAFYRMIYNRVGRWVNAADNDMSASFEFDARIYENLKAVQKENTDIYLYIKYGGKIGEHSLLNNGICNDEYYDGLDLTVCRLSKLDQEQFNNEYRDFLEQSNKSAPQEFYVPIKFWKLLKSISNQYCESVLERHGENAILFFCRSYVILKYKVNAEEDRAKIHYFLKPADDGGSLPVNLAELNELMQNVTAIVMKYAFGMEKMYCMNRYFEKLVIYSIISNANDVGDLIFAHWMATNWYMAEELQGKAQELESIDIAVDSLRHMNKFKVRKTIYSMIDRLDKMRMRSIPDMRGYFFSSFRGRICPEVTPENMEKTFHLIQSYCESFSHISGGLYTNSKLIDA